MKKTKKTNFINALLAGFLVFGCTCTLCNKKYSADSAFPRIKAELGQMLNDGKTTVSIIRQIVAR